MTNEEIDQLFGSPKPTLEAVMQIIEHCQELNMNLLLEGVAHLMAGMMLLQARGADPPTTARMIELLFEFYKEALGPRLALARLIRLSEREKES
jgi:hypothetical protein